MTKYVAKQTQHQAMAKVLNKYPGLAEAFVQVWGPIGGERDPGAQVQVAPPRGKFNAPGWHYWALRTLVSALMTQAPQAFEDLVSGLRRLIECGWDEERTYSAHMTEVDAWAARSNLQDDRARFFVLMFVYQEALHRAFEESGESDWTNLDEAINRWGLWWNGGLIRRDPVVVSTPALSIPTMPDWHPGAMGSRQYVELITEAAKRAAVAHVDARKNGFSEAGISPTPKMTRAYAHFCWYIRYQVLGESLDEVAEAGFTTKNNVWLALRTVTKLTGMPLRPGAKGGAPRKRKTSDLEPV